MISTRRKRILFLNESCLRRGMKFGMIELGWKIHHAHSVEKVLQISQQGRGNFCIAGIICRGIDLPDLR